MRYIDADKLKQDEELKHRFGNFVYEIYCKVIDEQPTAKSHEVVRGEWRDTGSGQECSVCKEIQYGYDTKRNYCPNCGADMRGEV